MWFCQCCPQRVLQIVGQDLGSIDPRTVFLFGDFLCAGDDAGFDPRYSCVEPVVACCRLVSFELFSRIRAALARPFLPLDGRCCYVVGRIGARARIAAAALRAAMIMLDGVSKGY